MIEKYFDRLLTIHLKDYVYIDKNAAEWHNRFRFCELGAGEMGDLNKQVITLLRDKGYEDWIFVEHDVHLETPEKDLEVSRNYIRGCGL